MRMRALRAFLVAASGFCLLAGTAGATGISSGAPYVLQVTIGGNSYGLGDLVYTYTPTGDGSGGTYQLTGSAVTPYGTVTGWDSTYDIDPQVSNNFTVVNTTALPQIFTVSVTSPIAPVLPTSLMRGSIGITLTDEGPLDPFDETDGVALLESALATDVYRAFLDGSPVQSLLLDSTGPPYTLTCGLNNCTTTVNANFGIPVRIPGPGASLTMGITVQFELSPGDSASVTSTFNIIRCPNPRPRSARTRPAGLAIAERRRSTERRTASSRAAGLACARPVRCARSPGAAAAPRSRPPRSAASWRPASVPGAPERGPARRADSRSRSGRRG
jgi:hypothetical protein